MAGLTESQKERFSRAFIVASVAAAGSDFTYSVPPDDIEGVDMVVRRRGIGVDFQLKATAHPRVDGRQFLYELDVRTYRLLSQPNRSNLGVLALIVVHEQPDQWVEMKTGGTVLTHCAYYLPLTGMPSSGNRSTITLRIDQASVLSPAAMVDLMERSGRRFTP